MEEGMQAPGQNYAALLAGRSPRRTSGVKMNSGGLHIALSQYHVPRTAAQGLWGELFLLMCCMIIFYRTFSLKSPRYAETFWNWLKLSVFHSCLRSDWSCQRETAVFSFFHLFMWHWYFQHYHWNDDDVGGNPNANSLVTICLTKEGTSTVKANTLRSLSHRLQRRGSTSLALLSLSGGGRQLQHYICTHKRGEQMWKWQIVISRGSICWRATTVYPWGHQFWQDAAFVEGGKAWNSEIVL